MKYLLTAILFASSLAHAGHYENLEIYSCKVVRVLDSTYFEEGLSKDEYPDIDVARAPDGTYSVQYGSHQALEHPEDITTISENENREVVVTTQSSFGDLFVLEIESGTQLLWAKVKVQEEGKNLRTVAYAVCNKES